MTHNSNENILLDDANSPDLNKRLMGLISGDFVRVSDQLKEASYQIRTRGFSDQPIFVASQRDIDIGQVFIGPKELGNDWHYKASYLDEFIQRELIGEDSIEMFKENFRNPDEYCCLFVVHAEFAGFVYIPFPED